MVLGDHVTMDAGTGLVHTAPGHGEDDFLTGQREGLPVLSPVDDAGRYTTVEKYKGKKVLDANPEIVEDLRAAGALVGLDAKFRHEYPHCWRCKNPVIFRATVQWFVRLDLPSTDVRQGALEAIAKVKWTPSWGEQRIAGMVENRREWVISRQRRWGSPITLLYAMRDGERAGTYPWSDAPAEQKKFFDHVAGIFHTEGADAWYARPAIDFVPPGADLRGFAPGDFQAETDIMDVWFDSGVSHMAVLRSGEWPELVRPAGQRPANLYIEGHDQHRGWFQSSLLTSVALYGDAPYDGVITHGFVVDGQGRKMSKSLGNVVAPQDLIKKYGADIVRLWVASLDYRDDDPISEEILARCAEAYRKVRNTARYLISNLYDFDPAADAVPVAELEPLDAWALAESRAVAGRIRQAYESYEFHVIYHQLVNFCATTLSAFYCDIIKDRLYASAAKSRERRSAQTALYWIARALATAAAPGPRFHRRGDLGGPSGKEGRIRPPRAFRAAGRPRRRHGCRRRVGAPDQAARRGRRDPGRSPQRQSDRVLPRGRHRPDRPARGARGGPGRDRNGGGRPGRPLHRLRDPRGSLRVRGRLARVAGLPRPEARLPQGARTPLRPLLEGDARGRGPGPLRSAAAASSARGAA